MNEKMRIIYLYQPIYIIIYSIYSHTSITQYKHKQTHQHITFIDTAQQSLIMFNNYSFNHSLNYNHIMHYSSGTASPYSSQSTPLIVANSTHISNIDSQPQNSLHQSPNNWLQFPSLNKHPSFDPCINSNLYSESTLSTHKISTPSTSSRMSIESQNFQKRSSLAQKIRRAQRSRLIHQDRILRYNQEEEQQYYEQMDRLFYEQHMKQLEQEQIRAELQREQEQFYQMMYEEYIRDCQLDQPGPEGSDNQNNDGKTGANDPNVGNDMDEEQEHQIASTLKQGTDYRNQV